MNGACKERWKLVGTQPSDQFVRQFTAATSLQIFFASDGTAGPQYLKSFSTSTDTFADESLTGSPLDYVYFSNAVGYLGSYYYFGNSAASLYSGATAWTPLSYATEAQVYRPSVVASLTTRRIYKFGGFNDIGPALKRATAYDPEKNVWQTSGLTDMPIGLEGACVGEAGGKIYLVGGFLDVDTDTRGVEFNTRLLVYDEAGNSWANLPPAGAGPTCFTSEQLVAWGSRFVVVDNNALWNLDRQTLVWRPIATFPNVQAAFVVVATNLGLYLVGYQTSPSATLVYKWMFN